MSVYDRPMFKKGGGAIGIMASGPELMKRFSNGGFNFIPTADANPVLTGGRDPMIANFIPGSDLKGSGRSAVNVPQTLLEKYKNMPSYTGGMQNVRNLLDIDPLSDMLRENQEKKEFQEKIRKSAQIVDDLSKDKSGEKINETNKIT